MTLTPQAMHNAVISVVLAYAGALGDKERQVHNLVKTAEAGAAGAEVWRKKYEERGKHNDELGKLARERGEELEQAKKDVATLVKDLAKSRKALARKCEILALVVQGATVAQATNRVNEQETAEEVSF